MIGILSMMHIISAGAMSRSFFMFYPCGLGHFLPDFAGDEDCGEGEAGAESGGEENYIEQVDHFTPPMNSYHM